ncbi:hypothetical protein GCM10017783_18340 [Deinococcus piscis]|uniref:DUF4097 domain-containing protein n=1 Tax=Deinococcus piscis TaxID=394230 RepID=A0ABQ3K6U6_9DEIO|nr:DUF4097 family beta strand repeat-containing protein [Deinococcus piscis]GHG06093.1 hypothetical protein GCM10017783_18340 [Deinococcus piscis]
MNRSAPISSLPQADQLTGSQRPPGIQKPLRPQLIRLLLGLALLSGGGGLACWNLNRQLEPQLSAVDTEQTAPLGRAQTLRAELTTDRGDIAVAALPVASADVAAHLSGHHRRLNPLQVSSQQQGSAQVVQAKLLVDPTPKPRTLNLQPAGQPVEHRLAAALNPNPPLELTARSGGGDQTLDLRRLNLRSLSATSRSGDQSVQLPAHQLSQVRVSTNAGNVTLAAAHGTAVNSVSAESTFGDVQANLSGARIKQLELGSQRGNIQARLPAHMGATISTTSGNLDVTIPAGAAGNLYLKTEHGSTALNLPANLAFRLSFLSLSPEEARIQANRLPLNLTFKDGAYLSPAAQQAASRAPLLDIELETPNFSNLTLHLQPGHTPTEGVKQP